MPTIEAVDLFCGVGGLTHGLRMAGISVVAGVDIDPTCKFPFETNHPGAKFILRDVAGVAGIELAQLWSPKSIRLLAGCAPCQPFSSYARNKPQDHAKWGMLFHFARLIREIQPELITMENVPGVVREAPFDDFVNALREGGYHMSYEVINVADFGVPQNRRRLVLVASRHGPIAMPSRTHQGSDRWVTVKDAVGNLPQLADGEIDPYDPLHKAARLSSLNKARIQASVPGGTWRDWPSSLVAECHKRESGKHSSGVYGRMRWDQTAPTMTTLCYGFGNGRFGHPEQDRAISLREAAIFQSFPVDYQFAPTDKPIPMKRVSKLIGNAVPPKLGEAVGRELTKHCVDTFGQVCTPQPTSKRRPNKRSPRA